MKFVDQIKLSLFSGAGGPGCVSFRKEPFYPRGGPNGGDGGRGGHVVLKASTRVTSLYKYQGKKKLHAKNGRPGATNNMTGADGENLVLEVPIGTTVKDLDGQLLLDLKEAGETVFLNGGRGGKGNHFFRTSVNQAPTHAQPGEEGEDKEVLIELKSIADVGIIGFPNAGKSTLVSVVTSAKPQIADYAFTTLNPQLGVFVLDEENRFIIADIPGLIKGAHKGQGLGHKFLKHIERTQCFVHLLDVSDYSGRDVKQDFEDINNELKLYDDLNVKYDWYVPLANRPQTVVFNKIDSCTPARLDDLRAQFAQLGHRDVIEISAVSRQGVDVLTKNLCHRLFERNKDE